MFSCRLSLKPIYWCWHATASWVSIEIPDSKSSGGKDIVAAGEGKAVVRMLGLCPRLWLFFCTWWFPKMGVPPVIIHFRLGFSIVNDPAVGYPHGNLHVGTLMARASQRQLSKMPCPEVPECPWQLCGPQSWPCSKGGEVIKRTPQATQVSWV